MKSNRREPWRARGGGRHHNGNTNHYRRSAAIVNAAACTLAPGLVAGLP